MCQETNFVEEVANKITELELAVPAILLLEAHKPLAFISSQLLLVTQPVLDIFLPHNLTGNVANLLADSAQLEQLITRLETKTSSNRSSKEADL